MTKADPGLMIGTFPGTQKSTNVLQVSQIQISQSCTIPTRHVVRVHQFIHTRVIFKASNKQIGLHENTQKYKNKVWIF